MSKGKPPTVRELRAEAKRLGLRGYSRMNKDALYELLTCNPPDRQKPATKAETGIPASAPATIAPPAPSPRCEVIGDATLWLGDCLQIPWGKVAHVITDPPYEASLHESKRRAAGRLRTDGRADLRTLDFAPIDAIRSRVVDLVSDACEGWFIVFATVEGVAEWARVINPSAIKYKRACIWIKPDSTPQLNGQGPAQGAECFVCAWAGKGHAHWNGGGKRGVYTHNIGAPARAPGSHPTEKPVSLMREIVGDFTKPGELVCDPFMGHGTTGVAALRLGRRFVGIELKREYFDVARRRIEAAAKQPDLFIPATRLRPKERRALAPDLALPMPPPLVSHVAASPTLHKADGGEQMDLVDYLKGDRRPE